MEKRMIRLALLSGAILTVLALTAIRLWAYPMTAACPYDGETAYSTGNTKITQQPGCTAVEYEHKGTDYSDPLHPKQFDHVFWATSCNNE